jgi:hypothetical protein
VTATTTTRLGLYKTSSDGSDLVNVVTDILNNYDLIDAAMGSRIVTSSTRPSTPYGGQHILESDTSYRSYLHNGSSPASGGWVEYPNSSGTYGGQIWASRATDTTTYRVANTFGGGNTNPSLLTEHAAAAAISYGARVAGDSFDRLRIRADGRIDIGPGTGARDTNLYRSATDTLKTDDSFIVGATLAVTGTATIGGDLTLSSGRIYRNKTSTVATTVANTITETVIATMTIPANEGQFAVYRIKAWGTAANAATTPNHSWRLRIGGVAGGLLGTIFYTFGAASAGTRTWSMEGLVTILTTGASGTWHGQLTGVSNINTNTTTNNTSAPVIQDSASSPTKDTTTSQDLVITSTWSAAASANTLTCYGYTAERVS